MNNKIFSDIVNDIFSVFLLQGILLVTMGILITVYPQIITWFVVGVLVVSGISAIVTAMKIKRFGKELKTIDQS